MIHKYDGINDGADGIDRFAIHGVGTLLKVQIRGPFPVLGFGCQISWGPPIGEARAVLVLVGFTGKGSPKGPLREGDLKEGKRHRGKASRHMPDIFL
jgi:hypothetical protein